MVLSTPPVSSAAALQQHQSSSRLHVAPEKEKVEQVFDLLVNKNAEGAKQDIEERTERLSLDISKTTYSALMKSPPDTYISFAEKGASNAHLPKRKILHQSILGGCYVGFGGLISLLIAGNLGGIAGASPGIAKLAFAFLFPINLLLIVATSGQLFTGNSATVTAARYEGFVSTKDMWRSFALSLTGNVIGCLLFAKVAMIAQVMNPGATDLVIKTAIAKCTTVGLAATVMRAIMCNWMVCMAVFLATAANDLPGKMLGCYLPISTFVGIGKFFFFFLIVCCRLVVLFVPTSLVALLHVCSVLCKDSSYCLLACLLVDIHNRIGAFHCQLVYAALGSNGRRSIDGWHGRFQKLDPCHYWQRYCWCFHCGGQLLVPVRSLGRIATRRFQGKVGQHSTRIGGSSQGNGPSPQARHQRISYVVNK
jgi:formate/nitrite transporter FocA (FNT family)